ncbi:NUDIX hydrolase [Synechococcus sp. MIT S9452]|uniref:NUDIX hydrolase n=1 Tax=Synechococcus sp. MIT S9452 TaxID=3082546 RepID=UPI0039A615D6
MASIDEKNNGNDMVKKGVVVFVWHDGLLLLILRDDFPWIQGPGLWAPVSGTIEDKESPSDCAKREINEETGVSVDASQIKYVGKELLGNKLHYYYLLRMKNKEIELSEGQEYKFIEIEKLHEKKLFSTIHKEERNLAGYLTRGSFIEYLSELKSGNDIVW